MKLPKKVSKLIDNLMITSDLPASTIRVICSYEESYRLYLLMLCPGIPFDLRCKAVEIYGKYLNPSFELPMYLALNIIDVFDLDNVEYSRTLKAIQSTKLILY